MKNELKKNKYPDGGIVYVIDYSTTNTEYYRIGMTGNMNKRKRIYDSHSLYKRNVVHTVKTKCPIRLEFSFRKVFLKKHLKLMFPITKSL